MNASTVQESSRIAHVELVEQREPGWFVRVRRRPPNPSESIVPKLAGYALLAFVLWLVVTTLIQPMITTQATRTVLQAPVLMVTSPISGVVSTMSVRALDKIDAGALVATVQNPTLDRDNLTRLTSQRLALQSQVSQLTNQLSTSSDELQFVEAQVRLYRTASMAQTRDAWQIAQRQRDVAQTSVAEQELKVRHTSAMLDEGAVSPQAMDAAQAQLSTSRANAAVADQAYAGLSQSVASASKGVFVSGASGTVYQSLASRRETLVGTIERAQHDIEALGQQLRDVTALEDGERRRVDKLASFDIRALQPGQVHSVLAPQGSYVMQGATLVRMIDCSRIEVVAVFPPRLARKLNMGSMLKVTMDDGGGELPARVTQLLPVAPEELQSTYAVPFPFAEQGSVYAVARIEGPVPQSTPQQQQRKLCAPGKVVTAKLDA